MSSIETVQPDEANRTNDAQAAPVALPIRPHPNTRPATPERGQHAAALDEPLSAPVVAAKLQELVAIQRILAARKRTTMNP